MTMTLSAYAVARIQPHHSHSNPYSVAGYLRWDGTGMRLFDTDYSNYAIDIRDKRLDCTATVQWPFSDHAIFVLDVDIDWVLSTVVIAKVHEVAIQCPWSGEFNFQTLFGVRRSRYADND
ncbi:MAG: hypothetical protein ABJZ55_07115 [Fuerstiella sp.]